MKRAWLSLALLPVLASAAVADTFANVSASGTAYCGAFGQITDYQDFDGDTYFLTGTSFYDGPYGSVNLTNTYEAVVGRNPDGSPVYETQYEHAEASAGSTSNFDFYDFEISALVFADSSSSTSTQGSVAYAAASANASARVNANFTITEDARFNIRTSDAGDGYFRLYKGGSTRPRHGRAGERDGLARLGRRGL